MCGRCRFAVNQCYGVKKAVNPDFDLEGTWKDSKGNILMFRTLGSDEQSKHYLWHEGAVASNPLRLAYRLTSDTTGLFGLANDWAVLGRDRGMGPSDQFVIKTGNIEVSEYTFYVTDDNELTDKYETVWTRTSLSSGPKYIGCFRDSGGRQIPNYRGQTNSVGECAGIAERSAGLNWPNWDRLNSALYAGYTKHVSLNELVPGDLLFYSYKGTISSIHHITIYAGNGMMWEANSKGKGLLYSNIYSVNGLMPFGGRV